MQKNIQYKNIKYTLKYTIVFIISALVLCPVPGQSVEVESSINPKISKKEIIIDVDASLIKDELHKISDELNKINIQLESDSLIDSDLNNRINNVENRMDGLSDQIIQSGLARFEAASDIRDNQIETIGLLLAIIALFVAVLGAAAYKILHTSLSKNLENEIIKKQKEISDQLDIDIHSIMARLFRDMSYVLWDRYRTLDPNSNKSEYLYSVSLAIEFAEEANTHADALRQTDEKRYKKTILDSKNDLVFHLSNRHYTTKSHEIDAEKAIAMSTYVYNNYQNENGTNPDWYHYHETHARVLLTFGDSNQQTDGKELIKNLCNDNSIPQDWRESKAEEHNRRFNLGIEV